MTYSRAVAVKLSGIRLRCYACAHWMPWHWDRRTAPIGYCTMRKQELRWDNEEPCPDFQGNFSFIRREALPR